MAAVVLQDAAFHVLLRASSGTRAASHDLCHNLHNARMGGHL